MTNIPAEDREDSKGYLSRRVDVTRKTICKTIQENWKPLTNFELSRNMLPYETNFVVLGSHMTECAHSAPGRKQKQVPSWDCYLICVVLGPALVQGQRATLEQTQFCNVHSYDSGPL